MTAGVGWPVDRLVTAGVGWPAAPAVVTAVMADEVAGADLTGTGADGDAVGTGTGVTGVTGVTGPAVAVLGGGSCVPGRPGRAGLTGRTVAGD